tara:strand:- start:295 stop:486 length:192 start_codon:yes stop_codon:yes gene_type:complete
MSSEIKFEKHNFHQENSNKSRVVKVTDLISKLNEEKKRERNSNIALSVAAVSAVTVFGIILSL